MAEMALTKTSWAPRGAWDDVAKPGRYGRPDGPAGVVATRLEHRDIATVTADPARAAELAAEAEATLGAALPLSPRVVQAGDVTLVWSGPGQWLALSERPGLAQRLRDGVGQGAAIADQSGGRALLALSGRDVRATLAKGVMVDLHPTAFAPGDALTTSIAYIGVQLWQTDDEPSYVMCVTTSFAGSLWSWLAASAAEFGLDLT